MSIFETRRLRIRRCAVSAPDIDVLYRLWNDPAIMKHVGFPHGLNISRSGIEERIAGSGDSFAGVPLMLETADGMLIGHCQIGVPDSDGISDFDMKILPEHQGFGYSTEVLRALVAFTFSRTAARFVRGTPNKNNLPSIRMQERSGLRLSGEGTFEFPPKMRARTCPVHYLVYRISREEWLADVAKKPADKGK